MAYPHLTPVNFALLQFFFSLRSTLRSKIGSFMRQIWVVFRIEPNPCSTHLTSLSAIIALNSRLPAHLSCEIYLLSSSAANLPAQSSVSACVFVISVFIIIISIMSRCHSFRPRYSDSLACNIYKLAKVHSLLDKRNAEQIINTYLA